MSDCQLAHPRLAWPCKRSFRFPIVETQASTQTTPASPRSLPIPISILRPTTTSPVASPRLSAVIRIRRNISAHFIANGALRTAPLPPPPAGPLYKFSFLLVLK
jgi:hypothetical protein